MKTKYYLILIVLLLISCNSEYPHKWDKEYEVKLLSKNDAEFKDAIFLKLYKNNNFEILVPIREVVNYIKEGDDDEFRYLLRDLNSLIGDSNKSNSKILEFNKFSLDTIQHEWHFVNPNDLFNKGRLLIFDTKEKKYLSKIKIHHFGDSSAPFVWNNNFVVFKDNTIIWKYHTEGK